MMPAISRRTGFTLVELLVVVAIIALLLAILLPSMNKARYAATIVVCLSQMHQMTMGIEEYTHDFDGYYPDGEWGRPDPSAIGWIESGGFGATWPGDYDFRPALREYFGADLNRIMKCPLAAEWWWDAKWYSDIDKYNMGASNLSKSPYTFYFGDRCMVNGSYRDYNWPRERTMRKPGEVWTPAWVDIEFSLLMSDFAFANGFQGTYLATTHRAPDGSAVEGGNYTNYNYGYRYEVDEQANANFASADGSAKTYYFNMNAIYDGSFTGIRGMRTGTYMVPTDGAR